MKVLAGAVKEPSELQEVASSSPCFEATALLPADEIALEPGRIIVQAEGYDRLRGLNLSNMFYLTHKPVEELRIEIHSVLAEAIDSTITGACVVNGSLLLHPDAKFSVQAEFQRDHDLRRGIR